MYIVHAYVAYLIVSLAVTVWVARTLHKNGRVLVVGFYLINVGWTVSAVQTYNDVDTVRQLIEIVSNKVGVILLVLGGMHFLNMYILNKFRRRGMEHHLPPPIPPNYQVSLG